MDEKNQDICEKRKLERVEAIKRERLTTENVMNLSQIFKALGDPTRLKIIDSLSREELCVCDIADLLEMNQSAISHQLRVLRNLRLVKYRKEGKSAIYSLDDGHVLELFNQGLEHINHK